MLIYLQYGVFMDIGHIIVDLVYSYFGLLICQSHYPDWQFLSNGVFHRVGKDV